MYVNTKRVETSLLQMEESKKKEKKKHKKDHNKLMVHCRMLK